MIFCLGLLKGPRKSLYLHPLNLEIFALWGCD
jgi:hypothetical protein